MFAVIETGGKQYQVASGTKLKIEKLSHKEGESVTFDKVLLVADNDHVLVGKPYLKNAAVFGTVLRQGRAPKIIMMRYHSKTRYRRRKGHRQSYTEIKIVEIKK